jgi:hypothetical protein
MKSLKKNAHYFSASEWIVLIFFLYYLVRFIFVGQDPYVLERSVIFPEIEIGILFYSISLFKVISKLENLKSIRTPIYFLVCC